ncbi:MAG: PEP-CTERM sorting domain-containing protein, partial [Dehalococcoidia bacterium]
VDFGQFDFMSEYDAASTEQLTLSSTIDNTSNGFEIYFLSSSFTANPPAPQTIPEPASLALFALGGAALLTGRRRKAAA